jgi:hypothetical protein
MHIRMNSCKTKQKYLQICCPMKRFMLDFRLSLWTEYCFLAFEFWHGVWGEFWKGLNYAISPTTLPTEEIITGIEKVVHLLPVETAEEMRQETVRITKSSKRPKDNLTRAERSALRLVRTNRDLTILPVDKGNATVILSTIDYKQKTTALPEDPAYQKLTKDHTESVKWKTRLLLNKSSSPEEVSKHLCPTGSRPLEIIWTTTNP